MDVAAQRKPGHAITLYKCSGGNGQPWLLGDGLARALPQASNVSVAFV